jgi:hypothetical protein
VLDGDGSSISSQNSGVGLWPVKKKPTRVHFGSDHFFSKTCLFFSYFILKVHYRIFQRKISPGQMGNAGRTVNTHKNHQCAAEQDANSARTQSTGSTKTGLATAERR